MSVADTATATRLGLYGLVQATGLGAAPNHAIARGTDMKRSAFAAMLMVAMVAMGAMPAWAQTISTYAGNGVPAYAGDGGPAPQASINRPQGLGLDTAGQLYIADTDNHRIRSVAANGTITTAAGDGTAGYGGDGGPAVLAQLNFPREVAFKSGGTGAGLYIADRNNSRVRHVDANGIIRTIAGTGTLGFSGDGGPASTAQLARPYGVAVDEAGNVYIADTSNHRIRKVSTNGLISTIAGTGADGISGFGGPAVNAQISGPFRVEVNAAGEVYFVTGNFLAKITIAGVLEHVAGTGVEGFTGDGGPATVAQLASPDAMGFDGVGNVYLVDSFNSRVRMISPAGIITTVAGTGTFGFSGDGGPAVLAQLRQPIGIAVRPDGAFFVSDFGNHRVRFVSASTSLTPSEEAAALVTYIGLLALPKNVASPLLAPLKNILDQLSDGNQANDGAVAGKLAEFSATVEAKAAAGQIDPDVALELVEWAARLATML